MVVDQLALWKIHLNSFVKALKIVFSSERDFISVMTILTELLHSRMGAGYHPLYNVLFVLRVNRTNADVRGELIERTSIHHGIVWDAKLRDVVIPLNLCWIASAHCSQTPYRVGSNPQMPALSVCPEKISHHAGARAENGGILRGRSRL